MTTRQRQGPGFDEEAFQKALDELERLLEKGEEGDDSDTTWQDDLPEAPDLPGDPGDAIVFVVPGGDGGRKPAWRAARAHYPDRESLFRLILISLVEAAYRLAGVDSSEVEPDVEIVGALNTLLYVAEHDQLPLTQVQPYQ